SIRFDAYGVPRAPHSFPTRRSSDLEVDIDTSALVPARTLGDFSRSLTGGNVDIALSTSDSRGAGEGMIGFEHDGKRTTTRLIDRSEEHTSELQSRENLVCRLLLEKK